MRTKMNGVLVTTDIKRRRERESNGKGAKENGSPKGLKLENIAEVVLARCGLRHLLFEREKSQKPFVFDLHTYTRFSWRLVGSFFGSSLSSYNGGYYSSRGLSLVGMMRQFPNITDQYVPFVLKQLRVGPNVGVS